MKSSESDAPVAQQPFSLRLRVFYRLRGEARWRASHTERISTSEAVIRGRRPARNTDDITFVITLPPTRAHRAGCLIGHGRVKRSFRRPEAAAKPAFAVAMSDCRLDRAERAFSILAR